MVERLLALRWLAYCELCGLPRDLCEERRLGLMAEFCQAADRPARTVLAMTRKRFFQLSELERETIDLSAQDFRRLRGDKYLFKAEPE